MDNRRFLFHRWRKGPDLPKVGKPRSHSETYAYQCEVGLDVSGMIYYYVSGNCEKARNSHSSHRVP